MVAAVVCRRNDVCCVFSVYDCGEFVAGGTPTFLRCFVVVVPSTGFTYITTVMLGLTILYGQVVVLCMSRFAGSPTSQKPKSDALTFTQSKLRKINFYPPTDLGEPP